MTNALDVEELLTLANNHFAQSASHMKKGQDYLTQYDNLRGAGGGVAKLGANRNGPKCLRVWAEYLAENGPSLRQEIQDATGTKFTERATPYTVMWEDKMATYGDDHYAHDTIVRMRSVRNIDGRAGTSTAYFLWSQRFDVYDRFGVGPREQMRQAMLGVVHPPTEYATGGLISPSTYPVVTDDTVPLENQEVQPTEDTDEPYSEEDRFATLEEWHERWDNLFDTLVQYDAVPTEGEKEEMLATMPEDTGGEPKGTVLARALHEARQRARS